MWGDTLGDFKGLYVLADNENNEPFDEHTGDATALSCSNKNGNQIVKWPY